MSIKNSIANCRKSFAWGCSREVFYSKKYDLVIKKEIKRIRKTGSGVKQTEREEKLFLSMTEDEKQFFPIVGFANDKDGNRIVIMNKIDTTLRDLRIFPHLCFEDLTRKEQMGLLSEWKKKLNLNFNATSFVKMIRKYKLEDLHAGNMGIYNNKIVIIDFGWNFD